MALPSAACLTADPDAACALIRGRFDVVAVIPDDGPPARRGLARALGLVSRGEASTLIAGQLRALGGSPRELVELLDWLAAAGARLVVLDVDLDTGSPGGDAAGAVLREIDRWEREPDASRPPRGRPGLRHRAPEVAERIAELRARGLSLRAIAAALEAEGVPTPRGGTQWRPSSVQAAAGYRRPRPPAHGGPPLPPAPPGPRGGRPGQGPPPPPSRP